MTLDTRVTWATHVEKAGKKAAQRLGELGLLHPKQCNTIQAINRPMMDYACPMWRFSAHSHVQQLQVLQSTDLRALTELRFCAC
jgi:hypothetical protein